LSNELEFVIMGLRLYIQMITRMRVF